MKKVGIMSMQRIVNYGSFLQAYALKTLIEELGYSVEFVDYHIEAPIIKDNIENNNKIIRKIKKGLETFQCKVPLSHKLLFILYKQTFEKKYLPLLGITKKMNYTPELDCLVIGSDEVFNCIQKNRNVGYSLELFGKNSKAKKVITYAASFGNTTLFKLKKYNKDKEISFLLEKINTISVRDENSGKIIKSLTTKEPIYNLDPVLVYDYINCCEKIPKIELKEKYIILYAYSGRITEKEAKWIKQYASKKGYKIYAIGGIQNYSDKFISCSPFEVLSYFKNAEEIITDTFHGSIFSIITQKKFTTLIRKSVGDSYGNEEKLSDLLTRLNLTERMTTDISEIEKINNKEIDYNNVNILLNKYRKLAKEYLNNNI